MNDFDPDLFQTKLKITGAAVALYKEFGDDFTLKQVAKQIGGDVADIFDYFPDKRAILYFYYESLAIRYRLMLEEIDDFENYLLAEKLSNFIFSSFDMMQEQKKFVEKSFKRMVVCSYSRTAFEKETENLLKEFFTGDPGISTSSSILMNDYLYIILRKKYLRLISFWLRDDSEGQELSMELTDKYTSFLQEMMYSATLDKGFDLLKFMFSNKILSRNIPFIRNILSKFEIRD